MNQEPILFNDTIFNNIVDRGSRLSGGQRQRLSTIKNAHEILAMYDAVLWSANGTMN